VLSATRVLRVRDLRKRHRYGASAPRPFKRRRRLEPSTESSEVQLRDDRYMPSSSRKCHGAWRMAAATAAKQLADCHRCTKRRAPPLPVMRWQLRFFGASRPTAVR